MDNPVENFALEIKVQVNLCLDSERAFRSLYDDLIKNQATISKATQISVEELDKKTFFYGNGDPTDSDSIISADSSQGKLKSRNHKNGENIITLRNLIIANIYNLWNDSYRKKIADKQEIKNLSDLKIDIFGDLRVYRECITHNRSRSDEKRMSKCKILKIIPDGQVITLSDDYFMEIIKHCLDSLRELRDKNGDLFWKNKLVDSRRTHVSLFDPLAN